MEILVIPLHQSRALISRPEVKIINSACICYRHMRGMLTRWRLSFVKVKGVFSNLGKISIPTLCFPSWAAQQGNNFEGKKERKEGFIDVELEEAKSYHTWNMFLNFSLHVGFFLRNCTNLPWPVKNNFIPCGFSQEERPCVMLSWGKFGHRRKEAGLQVCFPSERWFLYSDVIWSQGLHNMTLDLCCLRESSHHREKRKALWNKASPVLRDPHLHGISCPLFYRHDKETLARPSTPMLTDAHCRRGTAWRMSSNSRVCSRKAKLGPLRKSK